MSTRTGTTGIAPFVIQDDAIPQPAAYADQLNKGWHTRNTIAERNAIPLHYRGWGMVCVVTRDGNNNGVYKLQRPNDSIADDDTVALMANSNWVQDTAGIPINVDGAVTQNSNNPVSSSAVFNSLAAFKSIATPADGPTLLTWVKYVHLPNYILIIPSDNFSCKPGDIIFENDNNGKLKKIHQVVVPPTSTTWINTGDPHVPNQRSIPHYVFDVTEAAVNGLGYIDMTGFAATGSNNQLAYVRINNLDGVLLGDRKLFGGFYYKSADVWLPGTWYSHVYGGGSNNADSPYVDSVDELPYYSGDNYRVMVTTNNYSLYDNAGGGLGTKMVTNILSSLP